MDNEPIEEAAPQEPNGTDFEKYLDDDSLADLGSEYGIDSEQPKGDSQKDTGEKEPDLESQLKDFQVEAPKEGESPYNLLEEVNSLGLIRKGMPIDIENDEQLKEVLSKGFDYTEKTQELASLVKEQEDSFAQREQAFVERETKIQELEQSVSHEKLENNVIAQVLTELNSTDPDLYQQLTSAFQSKMSMVSLQESDPRIQGMTKELQEIKGLFQKSQESNHSDKNNEISQEWENGLSGVQEQFAVKLKTLGIKPNWTEVNKKWASDASGTSTVQEAFFAVHGDQLTKALAAQSKLSNTRLKSSQRVGGNQKPGQEESKDDSRGQGIFSKESRIPLLMRIAQKHA